MKKQLYLLILVLGFLNCSDSDDVIVDGKSLTPECFQDENRAVIATFENVKGTVVPPGVGVCSTVYTLTGGPDVQGRNLRSLFPCNLADSLKQDNLKVIYSGLLFETFETEDICAQSFEITDIATYESDNKLLTSWELVKYTDTIAMTETLQTDFEEPVRITFYDELLSGNTARNEFFANYRENQNELILDGLGTTEVAESDWGNRFYDSLQELYSLEEKRYIIPFGISNDTLRFEYAPSQFMVFAK